MAEDIPKGQIPAIYYHRKCRTIFTMKKLLDGILEKEKPSASSCADEKDLKRNAQRVLGTSRTYAMECIFCQKTSRYLKEQNTRQALVQ